MQPLTLLSKLPMDITVLKQTPYLFLISFSTWSYLVSQRSKRMSDNFYGFGVLVLVDVWENSMDRIPFWLILSALCSSDIVCSNFPLAAHHLMLQIWRQWSSSSSSIQPQLCQWNGRKAHKEDVEIFQAVEKCLKKSKPCWKGVRRTSRCLCYRGSHWWTIIIGHLDSGHWSRSREAHVSRLLLPLPPSHLQTLTPSHPVEANWDLLPPPMYVGAGWHLDIWDVQSLMPCIYSSSHNKISL